MSYTSIPCSNLTKLLYYIKQAIIQLKKYNDALMCNLTSIKEAISRSVLDGERLIENIDRCKTDFKNQTCDNLYIRQLYGNCLNNLATNPNIQTLTDFMIIIIENIQLTFIECRAEFDIFFEKHLMDKNSSDAVLDDLQADVLPKFDGRLDKIFYDIRMHDVVFNRLYWSFEEHQHVLKRFYSNFQYLYFTLLGVLSCIGITSEKTVDPDRENYNSIYIREDAFTEDMNINDYIINHYTSEPVIMDYNRYNSHITGTSESSYDEDEC